MEALEKQNLTSSGPEETAEATSARPQLTFAQNVIVTLKVLAGFGLVGGLIWGFEVWTGAQ